MQIQLCCSPNQNHSVSSHWTKVMAFSPAMTCLTCFSSPSHINLPVVLADSNQLAFLLVPHSDNALIHLGSMHISEPFFFLSSVSPHFLEAISISTLYGSLCALCNTFRNFVEDCPLVTAILCTQEVSGSFRPPPTEAFN